MKQTLKRLLAVALFTVLMLTVTACNADTSENDTASTASTAATASVWDEATYKEDTAFGTGNTTVQVEVKVDDKAVTFTLNTDKTTLADALLEHDLIAGDAGDYGLYVKVVNGITADYDKDGHYWSLCKNGGAVMTGVDATKIQNGEHYELVYAK